MLDSLTRNWAPRHKNTNVESNPNLGKVYLNELKKISDQLDFITFDTMISTIMKCVHED